MNKRGRKNVDHTITEPLAPVLIERFEYRTQNFYTFLRTHKMNVRNSTIVFLYTSIAPTTVHPSSCILVGKDGMLLELLRR